MTTKIPNDPLRVTRFVGRYVVHRQCALPQGGKCPRHGKTVKDKPLRATKYCEGRCDYLRLVIVRLPDGGYTHAETAKIVEANA